MKYLIINGDDFGSSYGANQAIETLFDGGFITSTTLMTPCAWAQDAVIRGKNNSKIKIGLHTTLTSEWDNNKWTAVSRGEVSSLIAKDGYFYPDLKGFSKNAKKDDVLRELEAQINWMISRDFYPTHVDNHMGTLYGLSGRSFLDLALKFCKKYNLPFRLPRNIEGIDGMPKIVQLLASGIGKKGDKAGVTIIDYLISYNKEVTKEDDYNSFLNNYIEIINNIKPGVTELFMHPMVDTPDGRAAVPTWQMRNWEFLVLQDEKFLEAIKNNNIKLIGWSDIEKISKSR